MSDESIILGSNHIWALTAKPSNLFDADSIELPGRCLALLRGGRDVALVPGGHEGTREFAEFCKETLSLEDWQLIYTDGEDFLAESIGTSAVRDGLRKAIAASDKSCEGWTMMPYTVTKDLTDLTEELREELTDKTFQLFGETPEWINKYGSKKILYRRIRQLDEPCIIETVNPDIKVPRGYVCSTVGCLLIAFRLLTDGLEDQRVLIKPVGSMFQGVIQVSSVNELKYYDFPHGEVIMQEIVSCDQQPDGNSSLDISPTVQYLAGAIMPSTCERITIGNASYGIRSATQPKEFHDKATAWSTEIVNYIQPCSAGSFGFVSVNGEPMMVDATPGALTVEHFSRLFVAIHSPGQTFCCWNLRPTPGMDVWTLWTRFCDRDIAFMPSKGSSSGVFPILFLKNSATTLIAIGKDDEEVSKLRGQADELFRVSETINEMKNVALSESQRRIWVHAPRPEYQRQTQRYNLPVRILSLIRKKKDIIILQGNHEPTREYWEFCKDVLELDDDQAIFTEGEIFNLDDDINDQIISKLRAVIASSGEGWTLVPYGVTYKFERWASQLADLGVAVFGESLEWVKDYGHKGILHRRIDSLDTPCIMETIDPNIRVAKGYTCSTVEDLLKAYQLMQPCKQVVIKPVFGAAGEGIMFVSSEEELKIYDFCMGDVCLEEFLNLDKAPDGLVLSPAMHYNEGVLIGKGLVDQIMVGTSYMGWRKSSAPKAFQSTASRYMQTILDYIKPKGPGGVDYLSVNGLPVLSDINTGRFNGAHGPKLFMAAYAPDATFYCWKGIPGLHVNVYQFWKRLVQRGIAFVPGKSKEGVFPLLYLRGLSGMYIAVAETSEKAEALHTIANDLLKAENANKPAGIIPVQKPSIFKKADIMRKSSGRIWATSSSEHPRRVHLRVECALRPACLLRPGRDIIIMPGNNEGVRDYFEFLKEVLGLSDDQVVWTNPTAQSLCLDKDIDNNVISDLKGVIAKYNDENPFLVMPMEISNNFLNWANKVDNIKVFGETPAWIQQKGFGRAMHRHMNKPEDPCILEQEVPNLKRVKGYIAATNQDLIKAYELLVGSKGKVVCVPILSTDGKGTTTMGSQAEMELYNFPDGEVVIREPIEFDKAADGLPIIVGVTYLKQEVFGQGFTDIVKLGSANNGLRPSVTSQDFQKKVMKLSNQVLKAIAPEGPGTMDFAAVNGEPVLFMLQTNRFTPSHYAKLFLEEHAPQATYVCWNFHPPEDVDVWTFWSRLTERNAEFTPGVSTRGVFPLLFLKNDKALGFGSFIAIGEDETQVEHLRGVAEDALREVYAPQAHPESVSLNTAHRRIWVHSARDLTNNPVVRYSVPARVLSLMRPGKDMVVLPGKSPAIKEFWEFVRGALRLKSDQVVFTKGDDVDGDEDIDEEAITKLKAAIVTSRDSWTLVPHSTDQKFYSWAQQFVEGLGVNVFGDDAEFLDKWGDKSILHRHISRPEEKSLIEMIDPNIRTPKGFVCSTVDDLVKAYEALGSKEVVLKPVACNSGESPVFLSDVEQIKLVDVGRGDFIIEECMNLDKAPDGLILAPAVHYNEGRVLNKVLIDQIMVSTESKGHRRTYAPKVFQKTAMLNVNTLISGMKPKGPGGFEFLSVGGHPVLTSVNAGSFTASHIPKIFQQTYAPNMTFYCWEQRPNESLDVQSFWKRLKGAGRAFVPGKSETGVFPLLYLRGIAATFIAIGKDELSTMVLYESAKSLLEPKAPSAVTSAGPVQSRFKLTLIKNAHAIFSPDCINAKHVLVGGTQIVGLLDDDAAEALEAVSQDIKTHIVDASNCIITPGFVDCHVHITGGGGELGPASRTPEGKVQEMIEGGMTTVVGVLGTDCVSRSLENLCIKARALNDEGITAYMWTGAYRLPSPTITGSVRRDVCLIEQCIGVGECAISDHRGSQPNIDTIIETAMDARVGGMLAGKAGLMYCHMGEGQGLLGPLREVVARSEVPITTFLPTHMERSEKLIDDGAAWVKEGGYVDFTIRTIKAQLALKRFEALGVPLERVSVSSDSYGSLPTYDEKGKLTKYAAANTKALLTFLWKMYFEHQWPLEKILPLMTRNPARILQLPNKGVVEIGADADMLLLDKNTLKLKYVVAKGCVVMTPKWTHAGLFGTGAPEPKNAPPSQASKIPKKGNMCC